MKTPNPIEEKLEKLNPRFTETDESIIKSLIKQARASVLSEIEGKARDLENKHTEGFCSCFAEFQTQLLSLLEDMKK